MYNIYYIILYLKWPNHFYQKQIPITGPALIQIFEMYQNIMH